MAKKKATDETSEQPEATEAASPSEETQPIPELPPIAGLKPGRIVHVKVRGNIMAAIVAKVEDGVTGSITAYVIESVAQPRHAQLPYAGEGVHEADIPEGSWGWMFTGQATGRTEPAKV